MSKLRVCVYRRTEEDDVEREDRRFEDVSR